MNNYASKTFIIAILLMSFNLVYSQDKNKEELRTYYNKMKELSQSAMKSDKTIYMDYVIVMAPLDKHYTPQKSSVKAWVNMTQTKFINDHMSVYKDKKEAITLLPDQKMIVLTDAVPMDKNADKTNLFWNSVQDTIFTMSTVKQSTEFKSPAGEPLKKVILQMTDKGEQLLHVRTAVFTISEKTHLLKEIQLNYEPKGKNINGVSFEYMDLIINDMQVLDEKEKVFPKDIEKMFFSSGYTMKKEYADYKLIDKRNIAKK